MATYTIVPGRQGTGFKVDVVSNEGIRQTMLGFDTEDEATSWIESDRKLDQLATDGNRMTAWPTI
jgi:antibiotic biosynthesis monooxygenase (ABM) superfamily enzyme